jgi:hypothetical protein
MIIPSQMDDISSISPAEQTHMMAQMQDKGSVGAQSSYN